MEGCGSVVEGYVRLCVIIEGMRLHNCCVILCKVVGGCRSIVGVLCKVVGGCGSNMYCCIMVCKVLSGCMSVVLGCASL